VPIHFARQRATDFLYKEEKLYFQQSSQQGAAKSVMKIKGSLSKLRVE